MEVESNQPLDLSKVENPRVVYYYNQRQIDFYEYERIVHKSPPVYNSIYRPNYDMTTPPPEYAPQTPPMHSVKIEYCYDNLPSCSKDVDQQSNSSSTRSIEIAVDYNDDQDDCASNKTFVCSKRSFDRSVNDDDDKISDHSCNSSVQKRTRYSSKFSTDYDSTATDEDREISSFTNNSATRSSPHLNSSTSSISLGLRDSPLTVTAKQEQAMNERINGPESLLKGLVYHGNMARQYPGADNRTPEQAEHRRKNSQAARLSRARAKAIDQQREDVAARTHNENIRNKKMIAALSLYANELNKLLKREQIDWTGKWKRVCDAKSKDKKK